MCDPAAVTSWTIDVRDRPQMTLRTQDFGKGTMTATAPIVAGAVALGSGVRIELELALGSLKTGNFMLQTAARGLIKSYKGDRLVFEAEGDAAASPWVVAGSARSGSLDIPMTVVATPAAEMSAMHIGGSVTMTDVRIPLPGMSGVSTITFDLDGRVHLRPA
jgi:hypothetical protein